MKEVQYEFKVVNNERKEALDWSEWLDFDRNNIANIAEAEGVYKIHAGMKILFIGGGQNLRNPCLDACQSLA